MFDKMGSSGVDHPLKDTEETLRGRMENNSGNQPSFLEIFQSKEANITSSPRRGQYSATSSWYLSLLYLFLILVSDCMF